MREANVIVVKLEKMVFKNKETGEVTPKTKITWGMPVETTEYCAGLQLWESYTNKTIDNLKNLLNKPFKGKIQEIQDNNRLRLKLSSVNGIDL